MDGTETAVKQRGIWFKRKDFSGLSECRAISPIRRIASFLREVFGLTPSEGSLVNWVNEAKRNAQPVIDKIKEYIKSSAVVGFDESGFLL